MFVQPSETVLSLPSGVRRIAEYSGPATDGDVVLVEVAGNRWPVLHEMQRKGAVMVSVTGNIEPGFALARSVMEGRDRATSPCRHRSKSR